MKHWLSVVAAILFAPSVFAQIIITSADMPVAGDSLRYSNATALGANIVDPADSGINKVWNFELTPTSQGLDEYKKPGDISPLFLFTVAPNSYGYKVADSIPGIGLIASGITINNLYTFFSKMTTPDAYAAEAFGASISGFPLASNYTIPDAWYLFPLGYLSDNTTPFSLKFGAAAAGTIKQVGTRHTRVDGWGKITTPYYTTPTSCIRVRSEVIEIDSVSFSGTNLGLPRTTIEYKWLVKGEHYPAMWATATVVGGMEIMTTLRYKDIYRPELNGPSHVNDPKWTENNISAYPIPAPNGFVTLGLPAYWKSFHVELFDRQGRSVANYQDTRVLDIRSLPQGDYIARIIASGYTAYVKLVR